MNSKSIFVIGNLAFTNTLWLEYHSSSLDTIYMAFVSDKEDIKKLQSLNLNAGTQDSYNSISNIINIAKRGGMSVPYNKRELVVKMRFSMCKTVSVIFNYGNVLPTD